MYAELAVRPAGVLVVATEQTERGRHNTTLAVARLVWALAHGEGLTVAQAAQLTGLTWCGAQDMLIRLSGAGGIPIYDDDRHVWQAVELRNLDT